MKKKGESDGNPGGHSAAARNRLNASVRDSVIPVSAGRFWWKQPDNTILPRTGCFER